jgi:hypothetical protein
VASSINVDDGVRASQVINLIVPHVTRTEVAVQKDDRRFTATRYVVVNRDTMAICERHAILSDNVACHLPTHSFRTYANHLDIGQFDDMTSIPVIPD